MLVYILYKVVWIMDSHYYKCKTGALLASNSALHTIEEVSVLETLPVCLGIQSVWCGFKGRTHGKSLKLKGRELRVYWSH